MNRRTICTGAIAALFGGSTLLQTWAASPKATPTSKPSPKYAKERVSTREQTEADATVTDTTGYAPIRQLHGNLTIEKAVEIALHQNPEIINAVQDIERTRGLIIEVRAAALPSITLTGNYDQQDRRLLRGGGAVSGASTNNTVVATQGLQAPQGTTQQTNSGFVGNTNTTGTGLSTGGTAATGATAVRALAGGGDGNRHATATTVGGTTTGTTTDTTSSNSSPDTSSLISEIQDALGQSSNSNGVQDKSWNVTLQVRQALYTGGSLTAAIKIAELTQDSIYYQLRDTVDRVIAEVRQQFYTVLLNRQLITVQEEAVRLAEQQLQDQRNRFEAGTVPRFNVLRAEVEVANVQPVLIRAKSDYLLARIQLAKSLGVNAASSGHPEFTCIGELTVSNRRISLPDALMLARARRPFLKIQRQAILIDVEGVKVDLAGYKPRLDARGGYTLRNRSSSDDLSDTANGWFFGVTGSWAIFDGFETYGRVKQSRARLEQAKITYDDSVREVDLEVQSAYANLEQARQTIESQKKNVEQAAEAVRLAQERFSAGAGTQLEILDARTALTRARTTELQSRTDFNRDLAEFDRATATTTVYHESFKDPLAKVEKGIFARLAETGLPKFRDDEPAHRDSVNAAATR